MKNFFQSQHLIYNDSSSDSPEASTALSTTPSQSSKKTAKLEDAQSQKTPIKVRNAVITKKKLTQKK